MSDQVIGIIAGVCTATSLLPQLVKSIQDKKLEHVSVFVFIILLCGNGLWVYYGILREDLPIIATNGFSCAVDLAMLVLKWKYGGKGRK